MFSLSAIGTAVRLTLIRRTSIPRPSRSTTFVGELSLISERWTASFWSRATFTMPWVD